MKNFTSFEKQVYKKVISIPLGEVRTYQWVAKEMNRPKAVRAVAKALKNNPFFFLIPCHRVVRKDGSLGGYHYGGPKQKRKILTLEKEIKDMLE
jgi:O-6-methylguanine DNA methyltransferase